MLHSTENQMLTNFAYKKFSLGLILPELWINIGPAQNMDGMTMASNPPYFFFTYGDFLSNPSCVRYILIVYPMLHD